MIEQIEDASQFNGYPLKDIFSIRILSLLGAYGCKYPFARFYRQINEGGNITAILSVLDKDITVSYAEFADTDEIAQFVSVIGYDSVLCSELPIYGSCESGAIMKSEKTVEVQNSALTVNEYPNLFDLFSFIGYDKNSFEAWYVDINHRIRHGFAKAFTLEFDNEIVSSAIFSSIYNGNAILTAVQTKPELRGMGYASALISSICCDFGGTIYLMRESGKNESFYEKLGFKNTGIWRIYI